MLGTSAGVPALLCFAAYLALAFRAKPAAAAPGSARGVSGVGILAAGAGTTPRAKPLSIFKICRASAIVLLFGFWLDGGLFVLAVTFVFWMLMELSRLEPADEKTEAVKSEPENEPVIGLAVSRPARGVSGCGTLAAGAGTTPRAEKGETWLRRASFIVAAIAALQTAVYVGTLFSPVNHLTLAIGRKCLIPPGERSDLDFLASNPDWQGRKVRVLLEHVDLANYNRRLINWKLDDSMYREYVLTPAIQPERDGLIRWRRPLWEYFYPGIRKQNHEQDAAKFVLQQLRHAVAISSGAPSTIDEMWRRKTTDAGGFEALCVAAFRSVGIPARLGGNGRAEFFDGKSGSPFPQSPRDGRRFNV